MKPRFCVVNKEISNLKITKEEVINEIISLGYQLDDKNPEIVITLGGDGTFLKAFHQYNKQKPLFIGINEGNLGFLCEFSINELNEVYEILKKHDFSLIKEINLLKLEGLKETYFALNEFRIESNNGGALAFDVKIDNVYFEKLKADGVCFSTALGSTGINKNINGAVVVPTLNVYQMSEKTPINNKHYSSLKSSLILTKDNVVSLNNFSNDSFVIYFDNCFINVSNFLSFLFLAIRFSFYQTYILYPILGCFVKVLLCEQTDKRDLKGLFFILPYLFLVFLLHLLLYFLFLCLFLCFCIFPFLFLLELVYLL